MRKPTLHRAAKPAPLFPPARGFVGRLFVACLFVALTTVVGAALWLQRDATLALAKTSLAGLQQKALGQSAATGQKPQDKAAQAWDWVLRGDAASLVQAEAAFSTWTQAEPTCGDAQAGLAGCHLAWDHLLGQQAAAQPPDKGDLAATERRAAKEHLRRAQKAAKLAFRLAPASLPANWAMAATASRLGNGARAAPYLFQAGQLGPNDARVLALQAAAQPPAGAVVLLRRALQRAPHYSAARLNLVALLLATKQPHAAAAEAARAVSYVPGHAEARAVYLRLNPADAAALGAGAGAQTTGEQDLLRPLTKLWPAQATGWRRYLPAPETLHQAGLALAEGAGRMAAAGAQAGRTLGRAGLTLVQSEAAPAAPAASASPGTPGPRALPPAPAPPAASPAPPPTAAPEAPANAAPPASAAAAAAAPPRGAPPAQVPAPPPPGAGGAAAANLGAQVGAAPGAPTFADPNTASTTALWQQALAMEAAGQCAVAEASWGELTRRSPGWVPPWVGYARAALACGHVEQAEAALRHALANQPHNPEAQRWLGEALGRLGDGRGAIAAFRRCVVLAPDGPQAQSCRTSLEEFTKQR